jgi:hypothetical protein
MGNPTAQHGAQDRTEAGEELKAIPMPRNRVDTTSADILADAGRALHGEHWRVPLSEDTGINADTIRHFMSGRMAVPDEVLNRVLTLVQMRQKALATMDERITAFLEGKRNAVS